MNTNPTSRNVTVASGVFRVQRAVDGPGRLRYPIRSFRRQHAQQQDSRRGQTAPQFGDDRVDPEHGVRGGPVHPAEVVRADQNHRGLGRDAVDLAVADAPQQTRGRVAFETKIDRVPVAVKPPPFGNEIPPGLGSVILPVLGDRIAQKDQVGPDAAQFLELRQVPVAPPFQVQAGNRRRRQDRARFASRGAKARQSGSRQEANAGKDVTTGKRVWPESWINAGFSCLCRKRQFRRRGTSRNESPRQHHHRGIPTGHAPTTAPPRGPVRRFAAAEARMAGRGGVSAVSRITGLARSTIRRGLDLLVRSVTDTISDQHGDRTAHDGDRRSLPHRRLGRPDDMAQIAGAARDTDRVEILQHDDRQIAPDAGSLVEFGRGETGLFRIRRPERCAISPSATIVSGRKNRLLAMPTKRPNRSKRRSSASISSGVVSISAASSLTRGGRRSAAARTGGSGPNVPHPAAPAPDDDRAVARPDASRTTSPRARSTSSTASAMFAGTEPAACNSSALPGPI